MFFPSVTTDGLRDEKVICALSFSAIKEEGQKEEGKLSLAEIRSWKKQNGKLT